MRGHQAFTASVARAAQAATAAACVLFVCAAGASAAAPNYRYATNAHDSTIAKEIAKVTGDLPSLGWKGGAIKADRSPDSSTCKGQSRDNLSGLTVTGDAAARFELPGTLLYVQVQLLARPAMAEMDWQRNHPRGGSLQCYAAEMVKAVHKPGAHLVHATLLQVPLLGDHQWAARAVVTWPGAAHAALFDVLAVSSGRTEYSMVMGAPDGGNADEVATLQVELRIALGLEARVLDRAASSDRGPAPRIQGAFLNTNRVVAVVHTLGLGNVFSQRWKFTPGCAAGGCVTTMSHPSLDHPGTTFRATLRPAGAKTYRARYQKLEDCIINYADGHQSVLPNQKLVETFLTIHVTSGPDGKATGYTGTRLIRDTPLAAARAHGCKIIGYELDAIHGNP